MNTIPGFAEHETLEAFALHVGPMDVAQYARWRNQSLANGRRDLHALSKAGWLKTIRGSFRDLLDSYEQPLVSGHPIGAEIDYGHWAYVARTRFRSRKMRRRTLYIASPKLLGCFGIKRRRPAPRIDHLTHDLSVTAVFLELSKSDPTIAKRWRHEQIHGHACGPHRKVVDVLIVDENQTPILGIDFLGPCYDAHRLAELAHELLVIRQIPFQFY